MTVDTQERSRQKAQPTELYLFRYGADDEHRFAFTDAEEPITITQPTADGAGVEEVTYQPIPIKRASIVSSGSLDKAPLEVTTTEDNPVVDLLMGFRVSFVVLLTIRQGHRSDPANEWLVSWVGRALSSAFGEAGEASITCEPTSTSMRRVGLRRHWQYGCPHWLYGPQCRADRAAATKTLATVSALGSVLIVADGFNTKPLAKYLGGLASWTSPQGPVVQTITQIAEVGDGTVRVVLGAPIHGLQPGQAVDLAYGCNHTMDDCKNLHVPRDEENPAGGNIHNYGGQPFIPGKNPIGIVNQYY